MSGMQRTPIQQSGISLLNLTIMIMVCIYLLVGCSTDNFFPDGRGDWTIDLLNEYSISKINSKEILLIRKYQSDVPGGYISIPNFFISAYQIHDPYICLKGIKTKKMSITDEELSKHEMCYYLINTKSDEIVFFNSIDELKDYCQTLSLLLDAEWVLPAPEGQ